METREKQLQLWKDFIVRYHAAHKLTTCRKSSSNSSDGDDIATSLWSNPKIERSLSTQDIGIVLEYVVKVGAGEWLDDAQTTCRIFWRTPSELASDIYEWAKQSGNLNTVLTVYELHSGEDNQGQSFEGLEEELIRRALHILEGEGKCTIFQGETSQEDGIKFH